MQNSKTKIIIVLAGIALVLAVFVVIIFFTNGNKDKEDEVVPDEKIVLTDSDVSPTEAPVVTSGTEDDSLEKVTPEQDSNIPEEKSADTKEAISVILGEYKGLKVKYEPKEITSEDIDSLLNNLKQQNTNIVNLPDRTFENGDMVVVNYEGTVDGKLIDALYVVCYQFILGRNMFPSEIEAEILKHKIGDIFFVDVQYPEETDAIPEIAGKTVQFRIELVDGFMYDIPEINDAFISGVTEYKSLEEYRKKETEKLQQTENDKAYEDALAKLKQLFVDGCTFNGNIDDEIKKAYILRINKDNDTYMEQYLMDAATYNEIYLGISTSEYQSRVMNEVTIDTKYYYAITELAAKENISREEAEQLIIDSAVFEGM